MKNENKRILIILIGIIVLIAGLVLISSSTEENEQLEEQEEGTEEVEEETNLNLVDVDQMVELFNGEDLAIIYIARPTCGYCVQFKPILEKVVKDYDLVVNYIDIDEIETDEDKANYNGVHDYMPENGWSTPQILIVKDGAIYGMSGGSVSEDTLITFLIKYKFIEED